MPHSKAAPRKAPRAVPPSRRVEPVGEAPGARRCSRLVVVGELYDIAHAFQHPALSDPERFVVAGAVPLGVGHERVPEAEIRSMVLAHNVDTIVMAGRVERTTINAFGELAIILGCRLLSLLPDAPDSPADPILVWEGGRRFVEVAVAPSVRRRDTAKRSLDVAVASAALVFAAPMMALAALAVCLEQRGNPLFGHTRIGRGGRRFRCWKLRTMYIDAERRLAEDAALLEAYRRNDFKLPDHTDPRVTRVGRLLRKTSLDELPQLWNVLTGEMSLVGPRPVVSEELLHYRGDVLLLLSVRPGLTGAWAVGGRHHLAYPQRADVELSYVRTRSVLGDLRIMLRTVGAVLDPGFDRHGK